ncbi:MAG: DUF1667 domain-containing protein [Spirochaetales bacterium]|nr:DUF1667 domain-containing protein [Spirochaetales bacterium]
MITTCILCPRGCRLTIDEKDPHTVTGNACPRGAIWGREEVTAPVRTLTATCAVTLPAGMDAPARRVPVRTSGPVPKDAVIDLARELTSIKLSLPVFAGDVVIDNWRNSGVSVLVTRSLDVCTQN